MEKDKREKLRKQLTGRENVLVPVAVMRELLDESETLGRVRQLRDDELEFADDFTISIGELIEALGRD